MNLLWPQDPPARPHRLSIGTRSSLSGQKGSLTVNKSHLLGPQGRCQSIRDHKGPYQATTYPQPCHRHANYQSTRAQLFGHKGPLTDNNGSMTSIPCRTKRLTYWARRTPDWATGVPVMIQRPSNGPCWALRQAPLVRQMGSSLTNSKGGPCDPRRVPLA